MPRSGRLQNGSGLAGARTVRRVVQQGGVQAGFKPPSGHETRRRRGRVGGGPAEVRRGRQRGCHGHSEPGPNLIKLFYVCNLRMLVIS